MTDVAKLADELNEAFERCLHGDPAKQEEHSDAMREVLWDNKAGIIAYLRLAAQQDGAWQPIETAPKDGTACIVYDGTVHVAEFIAGLDHWLSVGGERGASWPSMWKPCPAPPQS